jgi:glycyl-tRNA synthetase
MTATDPKTMDNLVALCKRRGFVFPASDIYGGINGFWDYGPLGVALKNNIRDSWWRAMVDCPPIGPDGQPVSIVGLDSAIIQNPAVWEASGHVGGFSDPMVDCTETKKRYRQDHIEVLVPASGEGLMYAFPENQMDLISKKLKKAQIDSGACDRLILTEIPVENYVRIVAPDTSTPGTLTPPRAFNLMFETYIGAIRNEENKSYLRPETAQGIFLNYKNILDTMRVKIPFGIAQIGKTFRNEVSPKNFIFRSREFEQMEMEWFCVPEDAQTWYQFWKEERMNWWLSLGIDQSNLIYRDHDGDELAHYSKSCVDIEYRYPFTAPGFGELEGIAHRGDFDLLAHQAHSKTRMEYFDQAAQQKARDDGLDADEIARASRYIPHVIEPASGLTRALLTVLCEAYTPDESRPSKVVMKFKPGLAPITGAVFPLINKDGLPEIALRLYENLRQKYKLQYDAKQSIGKRYARMDEAGTPYCFTIDGDTPTDQCVTVRDRDTASQHRLALDQIDNFLKDKVSA